MNEEQQYRQGKALGDDRLELKRDPDCPIEVVAMGTRLGAAGQPRGLMMRLCEGEMNQLHVKEKWYRVETMWFTGNALDWSHSKWSYRSNYCDRSQRWRQCEFGKDPTNSQQLEHAGGNRGWDEAPTVDGEEIRNLGINLPPS
ncbi:hypothetical protein ACMYSQ_011793 [Aspergillus niger]